MAKILLSVFCAVICMIALLSISSARSVKTKSEKMIDQAKSEGRVAEGKLLRVDYVHSDMGGARKRYWRASYGYEVDGLAYVYHGRFALEPDTSITLYYDEGRPDAAFSKYDEKAGLPYILMVFLPLVLAAFFYHFVF